jgi:hypothetical protein
MVETVSAGAIFQQALRIVLRQSLPAVSRQDIVAVLEAGHRESLEFLYEAGAEANLPHQDIVSRGAAVYFNLCAGGLSDDLSDGDCNYLPEPYRLGPCTQAILQTLFLDALVAASLPSTTLSAVAQELIAAVGPQHIELRTKQWTARLFRQVARGIGGLQWSAYLQILWCGTALAPRAARIGTRAGIATIVMEDIESRDPRYGTLSKKHKREIVDWAVGAAQALRDEHLRCLDALLRTIDPVLRAAR